MTRSENTSGSVVVTMRLPSEVAHKLRREATARGVRFNDLAKEVMVNHAKWGPYEDVLRDLPAPPALLGEMLNRFSDVQISALARKSGDLVGKQIMESLPSGFDIELFLTLFKAWLEKSDMTVTYSSGSGYTGNVAHKMSKKWSLYLAHMLESILRETPYRRTLRFEVSEGGLVFTIPQRHRF